MTYELTTLPITEASFQQRIVDTNGQGHYFTPLSPVPPVPSVPQASEVNDSGGSETDHGDRDTRDARDSPREGATVVSLFGCPKHPGTPINTDNGRCPDCILAALHHEGDQTA